MTELISRLEIKKVHQIIQRVDIFCSALLLQAWRRIYYIFNKQEVRVSIKERAGNCLRCGRCCQASIRCKNLCYDEKGLSMCKVYDQRPHLCSLYPYNKNDFFFHIRETCGYHYDS